MEESRKRSIWEDANIMIEKAKKEEIETVWDRFDYQNPPCNFCENGTSCRNCSMGPCRVIEGRKGKWEYGVCGADAGVIVARNFARFVSGGAAAHSDHGRDVLETLYLVANDEAPGYSIRDEEKLKALSKELGLEFSEDEDAKSIAIKLSKLLFEDYSTFGSGLKFLKRVPEKRMELWENLGIVPRGIDREICETMHRTHMGCDNDVPSILLQTARTSLSDGWGGSMIGTELSDVIFGTPMPGRAKVNLGVLKEDMVNVLVHGHNPLVSEMVLAAARDPEMIALAQSKGAKGINVAGLCCTGNELLMRRGVPLAGNHLMTELVIVTGAADVVVADYQCIMPSMPRVAQCYHTKFITTSPKGRFPEAIHMEVTPRNATKVCREIVEMAIEAYTHRDPARVLIPVEPVELMSGFSNEAILKALGGSLKPLLDAIVAGSIVGVAGVVGCNNPKILHDSATVSLIKELIAKDVLVVVTGCVTVGAGKAGLMVPEGAEFAGEGLKAVCKALGIPPVLHVGSCVDNSRILHLAALIANELNVDIKDLPIVASAPEWYSEKAASIGLYAVSSGIPTHLGHPPMILGSSQVTDIALNVLNDLVGAAFIVEGDMKKTAEILLDIIKKRRAGLGI